MPRTITFDVAVAHATLVETWRMREVPDDLEGVPLAAYVEERFQGSDDDSEFLSQESENEEGRTVLVESIATDLNADTDSDVRALRALSPSLFSVVSDALRVRGMDFVQDRLNRNDGMADEAADLYRQIVPPVVESATEGQIFDPNAYGKEND